MGACSRKVRFRFEANSSEAAKNSGTRSQATRNEGIIAAETRVLKSLESDIQKLERRFEQAGQEQKDLKIRVDTCTRRVKHAEILLKELGAREICGSRFHKSCQGHLRLSCDMFILAAIVAYSGSSLPNDRRSFSMFVKPMQRPPNSVY